MNRKLMTRAVPYEDMKAEALRLVLTNVTVAFILSVPMMMSTLGRTIGFFLMLETVILSVWYFGVCVKRKRQSYDMPEMRTVSSSSYEKRARVAWLCYAVFAAVSLVCLLVPRLPLSDMTPYLWFELAGDVLSPLLLFTVPAIFSSLYNASCSVTVSEEDNARARSQKNVVTVLLVVLAFVLSYGMLFFAAPELSRTSPQYVQGQQYASRHDIASCVELKNTDDTQALFEKLPMNRYLVSASRNGGTLTASYDFTADTDEIVRTVLYNATAATALLDDTETLIFAVMTGGECRSYELKADDVAAYYTDFEHILYSSRWNVYVTMPLKDDTTVKSMAEKLIAAPRETEEAPVVPDTVTFMPDKAVNEGLLILVNYETPYEGEAATAFVDLRELFEPERFVYTAECRLSPTAAGALSSMLNDYARHSTEKKKITVNSSYRSADSQRSLYASYVEKYGAARTAEIAAQPGYSEHQTGLAVDLSNSDYLAKHCAEFGFVLRYQKSKVSITHTANEPWHYRYVGVVHARYMMENDLCLEEYIDLLHTKTQSDPLRLDDKTVAFYRPYDDAAVTVSKNESVTFSGDNMKGYIVTVTRDNTED